MKALLIIGIIITLGDPDNLVQQGIGVMITALGVYGIRIRELMEDI